MPRLDCFKIEDSKKSLPWLVTLFLVALFCSGCGQSLVNFVYDPSVPSSDQGHLNNDMIALAGLNITTTAETNLMDISDYSAGSLASWISSRITYIVGQTYDSNANTVSTSSGLNPGYHRGFVNALDDTSSNVVTVASNLGGGVYLNEWQTESLVTLLVANQNVTVSTPRVGIMKEGSGLFTADSIPGDPLDSPGNSCMRIATTSHECRHSDGNGQNAALPHAMCSSGPYAGNYACENFLNGPYIVGRIMLQRCYEVCTSCSDTDLAAMSLVIADYNSRLVPGAVMADTTPVQPSSGVAEMMPQGGTSSVATTLRAAAGGF